jgi:hypothetical protein
MTPLAGVRNSGEAAVRSMELVEAVHEAFRAEDRRTASVVIDLASARAARRPRSRRTSPADAIDATFVQAVYDAMRRRRLQHMGVLPVPTASGRSLALLGRIDLQS